MIYFSFELILVIGALVLAIRPPKFAPFGRKFGKTLPGQRSIPAPFVRLAWLGFACPIACDLLIQTRMGNLSTAGASEAPAVGVSLAVLFSGLGTLSIPLFVRTDTAPDDRSLTMGMGFYIVIGLLYLAVGTFGTICFGILWLKHVPLRIL